MDSHLSSEEVWGHRLFKKPMHYDWSGVLRFHATYCSLMCDIF